jgi:hypothetical protein
MELADRSQHRHIDVHSSHAIRRQALGVPTADRAPKEASSPLRGNGPHPRWRSICVTHAKTVCPHTRPSDLPIVAASHRSVWNPQMAFRLASLRAFLKDCAEDLRHISYSAKPRPMPVWRERMTCKRLHKGRRGPDGTSFWSCGDESVGWDAISQQLSCSSTPCNPLWMHRDPHLLPV